MKKSAWVVTVDMGYGHARAADALVELAGSEGVLNANNYSGIPHKDKELWEQSQKLYEVLSRFKRLPILGDFVFALFDKFQDIEPFYPKERLINSPTLQLRQIYGLIESKEWGKHCITKLNKDPKPLVCTFFIPAFMAEYWKYKGPIFLVVTDSDVSRAWVPLHPKQSRIHYCVATKRTQARLLRYGVPQERITVTGFPLPKELLRHAKQDTARRIAVLDPKEQYQSKYPETIQTHVGQLPKRKERPVHISFAIGGAGAQEELGKEIIQGLLPLLEQERIVLHIIAGRHQHLVGYYNAVAKELHATSYMGKSIIVHSSHSMQEYFKMFTSVIRETDILWTKPSELSFYGALGIPLLLAPPVGAHEQENKKWLLQLGVAFEQLQPKLAAQWLVDLIDGGLLAEAALQGYVEMEQNGAENIVQKVLS